MKYLNFLILFYLISCKQNVKVNSKQKTCSQIIYKDYLYETIDTNNIKKQIIGYWFFDSIFINKKFMNERKQYKRIGFSFDRNRQIVEFELMKKGKKLTVIGNYKVVGDFVISTELKGQIKEYKVQKLSDSNLVLVQNYKGNNFVFVCIKDQSEVLIDKKIFGKKVNKLSSNFPSKFLTNSILYTSL